LIEQENIMGKTEKILREKLANRGFATFCGKRAFDVIERLEREGSLGGMKVSRSVYSSTEMQSQYDCPKSRNVYEITVSTS
jgi:hypothetical protein